MKSSSHQKEKIIYILFPFLLYIVLWVVWALFDQCNAQETVSPAGSLLVKTFLWGLLPLAVMVYSCKKSPQTWTVPVKELFNSKFPFFPCTVALCLSTAFLYTVRIINGYVGSYVLFDWYFIASSLCAGVVEEFFESIEKKKKVEYDPKASRNFLHPGRQAKIVYEGEELGYIGEVHPAVCDNYAIGTRVYIAVIDIMNVLDFATFDRKYEGIAKYPAVTRDLSMEVPKSVLAGDIEGVIAQRGGKILESYELFDVYEGDQIKDGYKSMAYSISFRAKDRTLEESDVSGAMKKILNGLEGLGARLRQ